MREQQITGNAMLHMNWTLRCFIQTDSHRKKETRSRKRSLGSARDDDTGKRTLSHFLSYRCGANLRPFGAPPSIGRRECPREPLPLEGAAERSEAGLASFWGGARVLSYNRALETIVLALFHPARTLSGSLRSSPSPPGKGCVSGIAAFSYLSLPHWGRGAASAVDRVLS